MYHVTSTFISLLNYCSHCSLLCKGLPSVLCHELLTHAHKVLEKQTNDMSFSKTIPDVVEEVLRVLDSRTMTPLLVHGPLGCDLEELASNLATRVAQCNLDNVLAIRFLDLTAECKTLTGAMLSILEQVSIIFNLSSHQHDIQVLNH